MAKKLVKNKHRVKNKGGRSKKTPQYRKFKNPTIITKDSEGNLKIGHKRGRFVKDKEYTTDEKWEIQQEEYYKAVRRGLEKNPLVWAKIYFKEHFRMKSADFHQLIMVKAQNQKFLAVAAPRGSSKTTITGFSYPLHQICHKKVRFVVYISNTYKQSSLLLHTLKQEVKENAKLKKDYPLTITKDAEDITIFKHPDGLETMVLCLGADQMGNIRGRKFGAYRPDLIILDDIETDELVRSSDRRIKLQEDFDNAVIPAGDVNTQYLIIGTILHDDSLLAKIMSKDQYKEFDKIFFQGLYKNPETNEYFSLWPEKMSVEWLLDYWKNKPYTFAKEIQNNPSGSGTEDINKKDFRYWRIDNMQALLFDDIGNITARYNLSDCRAAIAADLAWEDKQESDFTAIVPAFLTPASDVLLGDYIFKKGVRPNEFEEIIFGMEQRLKAITGTIVPIGFEKAKLEKVMKWFLKQAMRRRNRFLRLVDLRCSKEKVERIVTVLEPRYSQHTLYHKRNMGELETQLIRLRSATHDDLADAEAMVVRLLQYPKTIKKKKADDDDTTFMKLRELTANHKNNSKVTIGMFGMGARKITIPSKVCPIPVSINSG